MNIKRTIGICLLTTLIGSCSLLVKNEETFKCVENHTGVTFIFRHIKSKGIVKLLTANGVYEGQMFIADELGDNIIWSKALRESDGLKTIYKLNRKTMDVEWINISGEKTIWCRAEWIDL